MNFKNLVKKEKKSESYVSACFSAPKQERKLYCIFGFFMKLSSPYPYTAIDIACSNVTKLYHLYDRPWHNKKQ